ncbi:tRNA 2-thiouridine(34) synthase MnmA [Schleiferia thermophila]|mgnify:CR=1 FL=1|jgi:tRNA-specific 2-thiouridylase|uniref:tRNA-specific 2-thiouridylase MnmA n=1 Tax=Schleiferia thermophila TaxID=884107 RepID=A0A369A2D4_9FLAO|nr:tRNA 2-thiouridine(34) synthase MnmA [Schleiferia thermophila]KFD39185.1 thiouridylase [Schleiferia thermophila str. Yellowstone]RCX03313.1 tRNA (5-methylaminomethyl-2-thiouridylate)-methyltransferase [Schleiferia thermophila]GCD80442.1 tRNA-specific 2-thiouridylase MnmA [Schleiferia thermophila]
MTRVVVGLSGGVDSSVAALLLKQQGYEVIGMFMRNWNDESVTLNNECPWVDDSQDALMVADALGIPFRVVDYSESYRKRIVDYMFSEYQVGRTPNPDVLCNREIKFDLFLEEALKIGADYVATGHYCRKEVQQTDYGQISRLLKGADPAKDQSYFLCQVRQSQLAHALFPIGHLKKTDVRKIAEQYQLITARKKDSQGLCFIGKVSLPEFLQQQLKPKKGRIISIPPEAVTTEIIDPSAEINEEVLDRLSSPCKLHPEMGSVIGEHNGAHYYTIGQRKGLGLGGMKQPPFVIGIDARENILYVGEGENHPGLYRQALKMSASSINWIVPEERLAAGESRKYMCRIRYRQNLEPAALFVFENYSYLLFDTPQKAITPGQFAVWYEDDYLIGSGVID